MNEKEENQKMVTEMKGVLTIEEAATYLGVSKGYLYNLTSAKKIRHYKPEGKKVFLTVDDLLKWALKNPVEINTKLSDSIINK